jgi:LCP family protein required for cell wall assembly
MSNHTESERRFAWLTSKKTLIILAAVLLVVVGFALLALWERENNQYPDSPGAEDGILSYEGKDYVLRDGLETVLIIGLDTLKAENGDSYNNDKQADFLILLVIDSKAGTCKAIRINRDTMAQMNVLGVAGDKIGTATKQIALAHTYGNGREVSCRNVANAVSGLLLGVDVHHYVSLTMEAVPVYNDLVGGVTLEVLDDFTGLDDTLIKGETVTLTGEQALLYVRARYGMEDPTNEARMRRQRQYLELLHAKSRALAAEDDAFISRAALKLTNYLVSDCSGNRLESLLGNLAQYELDAMLDIEGESVRGEEFMEFYPDEDSLTQVVIECFYKEKD